VSFVISTAFDFIICIPTTQGKRPREAYDSVISTARSAHDAGFQVALIEPMIKGIDGSNSAAAIEEMRGKGALVLGEGGSDWEEKLRSWIGMA
jgi:hypothetical protein